MESVIDHPDDLTPKWLTEAFHTSGHPLIVSDVRFERFGSGHMGATYRLDLSYEGEQGPPTLIAKLAGDDEDIRALVAPGYAAEVGFYSTLASGLNVRTPRSWYGAITDDHTRFTLLLEDMFPATPGTQADGCTVEQATGALLNLVGLHVSCWNDPKLTHMDFLMRPDRSTAAMMAQVMCQACDAFIERYAGELAPEDAETLSRVCTVIERWQLTESAPFSLIHGDYRLDNLLFDPTTREVTAVDWQTAAIGPPLRDVAYFLGTSLRSEDRVAHEVPLVRAYHSALLENGVRMYTFDECWGDYRIGQLQGPMMTVIGCIYSGSQRTPRSDAMFVAMARRSCAAVRDLGSPELV